jgi:hypothetical protein
MAPLIYQGLRKMLNELKDLPVSMDTNEYVFIPSVFMLVIFFSYFWVLFPSFPPFLYRLKAFTYNAIALLAKRIPTTVSSDFDFLANCFEQIKSEEQRVKVAIQEALNVMCIAYAQVFDLFVLSRSLLVYCLFVLFCYCSFCCFVIFKRHQKKYWKRSELYYYNWLPVPNIWFVFP